MTNCVVDTSVLIGIFVTTEARHAKAAEFADWLIENKVRIKVPMHAFVEVQSALKNKQMHSGSGTLQYWDGMPEDRPLWVVPVPLDQAFLEKHLSMDLPYLKGADLIFLSVAKSDGAILITEDDNQYKAAKAAGVPTYRIDEFLSTFTNA